MPTLYLVGTPIGNLEDITLRAVRILNEVGLVAAEDTRKTGRLLKHYDIKTALVSFHDHSGQLKIDQLVEELEQEDIALVSDAGMPGLSDPGFRLVRAAAQAGIRIEPIPGPSAAVTALVSSGLPTDRYLYLGFLPRQQKGRRSALKDISTLPYTIVLFEAPHRLLAFLADAVDILGERQLCIGRELTKMHEEIWRGSISEAAAYFSGKPVKGEITIVISGVSRQAAKWEESQVRQRLKMQIQQGNSRKDASAAVAAESGWSKRDVYKISLEEEI